MSADIKYAVMTIIYVFVALVIFDYAKKAVPSL